MAKVLVCGEDQLEVGAIYTFDDIEVEFKGYYKDNSNEPGLYWSKEEQEYIILEAEEPVTASSDLLAIVNDTDTTKKHSIFTDNAPTEPAASIYLRFAKEFEDDEMVTLVKDAINKRELTAKDILSRNKNGSNLISGLRQRHTMTLASFKVWAELLGMQVKISLE